MKQRGDVLKQNEKWNAKGSTVRSGYDKIRRRHRHDVLKGRKGRSLSVPASIKEENPSIEPLSSLSFDMSSLNLSETRPVDNNIDDSQKQNVDESQREVTKSTNSETKDHELPDVDTEDRIETEPDKDDPCNTTAQNNTSKSTPSHDDKSASKDTLDTKEHIDVFKPPVVNKFTVGNKVWNSRKQVYTRKLERSVSANMENTLRKNKFNINSDLQANIYHHFHTKKRHLSADSGFCAFVDSSSQKIVNPFPVQHWNENRFKAGVKLGLYKQRTTSCSKP